MNHLTQPIIRIELEGVRSSITQMMSAHHNEFNEMVKESVETYVTPENLQRKIDTAVQKAIDNAIDELSNDYYIKQALKTAVINLLTPGEDQ